jgi:16S rRNA (uracil1498-N3)-methyltransferase
MQLFYHSDISTTQNCVAFDKEESKHITKVLRKKTGDMMFVTNGKGYLFETKIIQALPHKCVVEISNSSFESRKPFHLHLVVAPTKMNDRFEWFIEKATEIGIHEITPIICDHSERKIVKIERFEKIISAAMKQANLLYLPKINEAITFKKFMALQFEGQKFIAHCEETERFQFKNCIQKSSDVTLLIGPEGDFSSSEIEKALEMGYKPVTLGNTRLRTETAAIVGCHTVVMLND